MHFWLNAANGEWGVLKESARNEALAKGTFGTLVGEQAGAHLAKDPRRLADLSRNELLVMDKAVFVRLYECLERLSMAPTYSPVLPSQLN